MSKSLGELKYLVENASGGIVANPGYIPPNIAWMHGGVCLPKGRYFMAGPRSMGQYQDVDYADQFIDLQFPIYASLSEGVVGSLVQGTWYSVYLKPDSSVEFLPHIKINGAGAEGSDTYVNPGRETAGAENGWITTSGIWNGYRVLWIGEQTSDIKIGNQLNIIDSVPGSPSKLVVEGNHTVSGVGLSSYIGNDGPSLDLAPPAPCLYLGRVYAYGSNTGIRKFTKKGWRYTYAYTDYVVPNRDSSESLKVTGLHYYVPPSARLLHLYVDMGEDSSLYTSGHRCTLSINNSNWYHYHEFNPEGSYSWRNYGQYDFIPVGYTQHIYNFFSCHRYGTLYTPEYAAINFHGFEE